MNEVEKLERRRSARIASASDNWITALAFFVTLVGGIAASIALWGNGYLWWGIVSVLPFVVTCGLVLLVLKRSLADCVEAANENTQEALIKARKVWLGLPADLQDRTRPIIDAAYTAAVLPRDASTQVGHRLKLLREFAEEAEQQKRDQAMQALGTDDLETGKTFLVELRRLRNTDRGGV
jgi:hypothetical protein